MAAKKPQNKNRGRTTIAAAAAHSITTILFGKECTDLRDILAFEP
jgi:hypothetical protein